MTFTGIGYLFRAAALAALLCALVGAAPAAAQQGLANTLSGFSVNSDKPISINAEVVELRDKDKVAICSGNVKVTQGDVTLKTARLKINYEEGSGEGGQQRITRLEAQDKVLVTLKDQTLSGDHAVFEMKKQLVTVTGNVVLSQGANVLRGSRLTVNLETGQSRLEAGPGKGRVSGSFVEDEEPESERGNGGDAGPVVRPQGQQR